MFGLWPVGRVRVAVHEKHAENDRNGVSLMPLVFAQRSNGQVKASAPRRIGELASSHRQPYARPPGHVNARGRSRASLTYVMTACKCSVWCGASRACLFVPESIGRESHLALVSQRPAQQPFLVAVAKAHKQTRAHVDGS
jgi:hypothetical protein